MNFIKEALFYITLICGSVSLICLFLCGTYVCLEDFIPKAVLRDTLDKHIVITDNIRYYNADSNSKQIINDIEKLMEE